MISRYLNSTQSQDWRTIHETLCTPEETRNGSCHSPHEQLLTLASGGGGTNGSANQGAVYLVSEQRYPFRNSSDNQGLVRIVRLQREGNGAGSNADNSATLTPDQTFGVNGSVLLNAPTTQENRTLLRGLPVSQKINGTHLTSLYAAPTGVALVRFPLTEENNRDVDNRNLSQPARPPFPAGAG